MNKNASPWFKVFALCTAVGLGGTYVWRQQQKAAPPKAKPVERTVLSSSKSFVIVPNPLPVDEERNPPSIRQEPEAEQRILMPSSKVGVFLPEKEVSKQRILLPGSSPQKTKNHESASVDSRNWWKLSLSVSGFSSTGTGLPGETRPAVLPA
jgi:hypothetical protein